VDSWEFSWVILWVLALIGLALLVNSQWECRMARKEGSAIEILKVRYVKGEIN
jgi:uncharacterized membrane protein